jgi:ParB-like chromosome segregation protein Spo0J
VNIEQIATNDLIPYARNSRTHSDEQIAQVAASIREFGFTNPVLIDQDNGIIAGHGRVMAATRLKLDTVPCIRLSHLSDTQKRAYIIADNKLALNSGWDEEMLKLELIELDALGFDVDLIGFDDAELNVFLSDEEDDNADYSDKNKEIDVDALEEMMELKFKLTFDEYQEAKERLSEISSTPENALKLLLKMEI